MLFWFGGNLVLLGKARKRRRRRLIEVEVEPGQVAVGVNQAQAPPLGRARVRVDPGVEKGAIWTVRYAWYFQSLEPLFCAHLPPESVTRVSS
jgi:hypothetical protein